MAVAATVPDPVQFFLSRSGDVTDIALAVDRILMEAHQKTVLQTNDFTHEDFMAALERAMQADDGGARMVAVVSEAYQDSKHCRVEYRYPLIDDPENEHRRLIVLRVADAALPGFLKPIDYVDLVPVLAIEDDGTRESLFRDVVLAALGVSGPGAALPYVHEAVASTTPATEACVAYLRSESQRADLDDSDLGQIAEALGRQTAAIELAARLFAERPAMTSLTYFGALAEHMASAPLEPGYPSTLRAALLTSFEVVEHEPAMQGHSATSILALAAYLSPHLIPPRALKTDLESYPVELQPFVVDAGLRDRALDLLDRLALIVWHRPSGCFSVSPATQRIVRDLLADSGEAGLWQQAAARIMSGEEPATMRDHDDNHPPPASDIPAEVATAAPRPVAPADHQPTGPSPVPQGGDTVRRLVQALKEPAADLLSPQLEPLLAEEPPPLVIDESRAPPRIFNAENEDPVALETEVVMVKSKRRILPLALDGSAPTATNATIAPEAEALDPPTGPQSPRSARKPGFLGRLFGR